MPPLFLIKKKIAIAAFILAFFAAVYILFLGSSIRVPSVPFGLAGGTRISIKEEAKFPKAPSSVRSDLRRADDLRIAGALEAAQSNYESILVKYPDLPEALFGAAYSALALSHVSSEQMAKAKAHAETLARQMPGSAHSRLISTFLMEKEGNLSHALEAAAELAKASPAFAEARLRNANLLLASDQPFKAISEAKAAISISEGSDVRPFISLAFALHSIGDLKECSELVDYAIPRFPSQTEFLLLHGFLSEYSYSFDEAQSDYKKIMMLNPGDPDAMNAMATLGEKTAPTTGIQIYAASSGMSLKDITRETEKILLPLIKEYPENLPLREALGKIYLRARMMREAKAQFSEIYSQDFEYPNIRKLLNEASEEFASPAALPKSIPARNDKNLADSLARAFAELKRSAMTDENDELGRYLVHYGASFKDFFSKYSITKFERLDEKTFLERYNIGTTKYTNTVYFDSKKRFYAVRSIADDSSDKNSYSYIPDLFGYFLKKETGILGDGVAVNSIQCDDERWSGVIWASRDNFELLAQNHRNLRRVYMLRLNAKRFPDTGNLCPYISMIRSDRRMP